MAQHATPVQSLNTSSRHASYRLSLIDPSTLAPLTIDPLDTPCFTLFIPCQDHTFTSLLVDPQFQDGAIVGYADGDLVWRQKGVMGPAGIANWIWSAIFCEVRFADREDTWSWLAGYLLGVLSRLVEREQALACVGFAHLCFLFSQVPTSSFPLSFELSQADVRHREVVRAYRAEVRMFKARGLDFFHASRAALAGGPSANAHPLARPTSERQTPVPERSTLQGQRQVGVADHGVV